MRTPYKNPYARLANKRTELNINKSVEGEPIEMKVFRMKNNNEPIENQGSLEMDYHERGAGVPPASDIRTDRFETAREAASKLEASITAQRTKTTETVKEEDRDDGKPETTQTT